MREVGLERGVWRWRQSRVRDVPIFAGEVAMLRRAEMARVRQYEEGLYLIRRFESLSYFVPPDW